MEPALCSAWVARFPRTRYQGSKRRYAAAIVEQLRPLSFTTVLDAFGGTGAVAYEFKRAGKCVTYNDILAFNHQIGLALIENNSVRLSDDEIAAIGERHGDVAHGDFIERNFEGIYFTTDENRWLDSTVGNIRRMTCSHGRALAWYALFQAAMAKRPYNLFHRGNLYMRTADVPRSFGNKASWDRSFAEHFYAFAREASDAVFTGVHPCRAICRDAADIEPEFDLVYMDPPYVNRRGVGVDYRSFYHFLEGMVRYEEWPTLIDQAPKHRPFRRESTPWTDASACVAAFQRLFARFRRSILVVSYRSDGIPNLPELESMLRAHKKHVRVVELEGRTYALSTTQRAVETLLIGHD